MTYADRQHEKNSRRATAVRWLSALLFCCFAALTGSAYAQIVLPGAGLINTVAGDATQGYSGDGGAATSAELYLPGGVAVDTLGNIYIADTDNNRIRKVSAATGFITTVAGGGTGCSQQTDSLGDGCPATNATLNLPWGVAVDTLGNIYITDTDNNRIREVSAATGFITTVAGNGTAGYSGDGGAAISATLNLPWGVAVDTLGNIYIADYGNNVIREVTAGIISTVAGNGTSFGYSGNGGAATSATLWNPSGVAVDIDGNIYIADTQNNAIRKVTVSTGKISTVAGKDVQGYSGDGGDATKAELSLPSGVAVDTTGNIYIADTWNNRIRAVGPEPKDTPTLSVETSGTPSLYGGPVTFTATITKGTSGTVTFNDGGTAIGTGTISGTKATFTTNILAVGTHTITAVYSGDLSYNAVTSSAITQTVSITTTTVALASSLNPSIYGQSVTITATVTPSVATGTVTFRYGHCTTGGPLSSETVPCTTLGTATLSGGTATFSTSALAAGSYSISAVYGGDSNCTGSTSGPLTQTVNQASTTTAVASSLNPSAYGQSVTLTATVKPSGATGTVTFLDGSTTLGTGTVASGTASYTTTALAGGSHSITAVYGGDGNFLGSTSPVLTQTVIIADAGTITLTVNNIVSATTNYGLGATTSTIAAGLAAGVTANSVVKVTAVNDALYIEATQTGAVTDYSYTVTTSYDSTYFNQPSFSFSPPSGSLDGGANQNAAAQTVYSYCVPGPLNPNCTSSNPGYAGNGNLLYYTDSVMGTWTFNYDALNRLVGASDNPPGNQSTNYYCWSYDAFGNRYTQMESDAAFQANSTTWPYCAPVSTASILTNAWAQYNTNNQMTSTSQNVKQSAGYDTAGDVTNDGVNTYLYDAEGRICAVSSTPATGYTTMTGYIYDASGQRVAKGTISTMSCDPSVNGFSPTNDYIIGPSGEQMTELAMDANNSMAWQHTNVYAAGRLLATYDPNGVHFYLTDPLGTRRAQTDYAGVLEQTCSSLPFGDALSCTDSIQAPTEHHFTGKERDTESGLDNFGARYMGSSLGRFMTPDPLLNSGRPGSPQTWNRYAYALNNPLKIVDPTGLYNVDCGSDKTCIKAAKNLKNGLSDLQKKVDKMKDGTQKTRLENALKAMGTENDKNNVNVSFGATKGGGAGETVPVSDPQTYKESYNVTFDPSKLNGSNDYAIAGAHEGTHVDDFSTELANPNGQPLLSDFSVEYRGYQTSAYAASALGQDSLSMNYDGKSSVIWNGSWGAVDKNITNFVTSFHDKNGKPDHTETTPHNPWPN